MLSLRRTVTAATLVVAALGAPLALAGPASAASTSIGAPTMIDAPGGSYYDRCIALQRRAYRQDVRDVGRYWADVVWVGRQYACEHGWSNV